MCVSEGVEEMRACFQLVTCRAVKQPHKQKHTDWGNNVAASWWVWRVGDLCMLGFSVFTGSYITSQGVFFTVIKITYSCILGVSPISVFHLKPHLTSTPWVCWSLHTFSSVFLSFFNCLPLEFNWNTLDSPLIYVCLFYLKLWLVEVPQCLISSNRWCLSSDPWGLFSFLQTPWKCRSS